jgi:acetoin utilization deacetylase AcuC-like enzyme
MQLSVGGYSAILRRIKALADEFCDGRIVLSLEGGYDLDALSCGVKAVFDVLLGNDDSPDLPGDSPEKDNHPDIAQLLVQLKQVFELT